MTEIEAGHREAEECPHQAEKGESPLDWELLRMVDERMDQRERRREKASTFLTFRRRRRRLLQCPTSPIANDRSDAPMR